ncbi:MAG: helix-turn-helix transcriptional regulator [Acidimicrobiales bacterium]
MRAQAWRSVQRQARALGDPTRFAIFRSVAAAEIPVRVAVLTQQFSLNHNAVRQHLAKLCEAGLLVEELAARRGPGRPALQYRLAPGVHGMWATRSPYEQLSLYLLEIASSGRSARDVGAEAGRESAEAQPVSPNGDGASTLDRLLAEMQRRGFEPRLNADRVGTEITLDFCPLAAAASMEPEVVCEIHLGLIEGFLGAAGGDVVLGALKPKNPQRAGCRVLLNPR